MTATEHKPACVLSIAGSDSGGGAGIQADLKVFARCGVHGMTAVTAITAQSTVGVTAVHAIPPEVIVAQVAAVADDLGVDAVKIGMLGSAETVEAVDRALSLVGDAPIVLDPVMVAESGAPLIDEPARSQLVERLVARATVLTPNVAEASSLTAARGKTGPSGEASLPAARGAAQEAARVDELADLAERVHALGPDYVVVTGGHAVEATDVFFGPDGAESIPGERHPAGGSHGSGCTHSSALAAQLALGETPLESARLAKRLASEAVRDGLREIGRGAGPVNALGAVVPFASTSTASRAGTALT